MYLITIRAIAGSVQLSTGMEDEYDQGLRSDIDGLDCDECFSDYFPLDRVTAYNVLTSGFMRFEFDQAEDELFVLTEYESSRELTPKELDELADYTQGQWSDGIGEGFEQRPCRIVGVNEYYVSPWYRGQKLEIHQKEMAHLDD